MMNEPLPVLIPLLNPNEIEALLAALYVKEGQAVSNGDLIASVETTKSNADIHAERAGFIAGIGASAGETVRAGQILCYLAPDPGWQPPTTAPASGAGQKQSSSSNAELPAGLRVTQPALALARSLGVEISRLPIGPLVTERNVRDLAGAQRSTLNSTSLQAAFDPTAVLIYGGGGHGKSLIDLIRTLGVYQIAGIIDDGKQPGDTVMGLPVLGGNEALAEQYAKGVRLAVNAVGGIGNIAIRIKVFQTLAEAGFTCPAVVHASAVIEPSAVLSAGVQIFPHAYVGSEAHIGYGVIVNTGAIVSHDCQIGDYSNLSPGAILAGEVQIGEGVLVGMGVTVNLGVKIGRGVRIGNSATVKSDIPEGGIVRAGTTWPS